MMAKCEKCEQRCGRGKVKPNVLINLEEGYRAFSLVPSESLLKRYLTRDIYEKIKTSITTNQASLLDCVQSGFENPNSIIGVYASDPDAYTAFSEIFDPIIEDFHRGFRPRDKHPPLDFGDPLKIANLDPSGGLVLSTRVRGSRSLQGYPFHPCLTEKQYGEIEGKIVSALKKLDGSLMGSYTALKDFSKDEQARMVENHIIFQNNDNFLKSAGVYQFWPNYRGIYLNYNKTFIVWVNEEDHLRVISFGKGGDLSGVYKKYVDGMTALDKLLTFNHSNHLGYVNFCPSNLGTAMRVSVHIKLANLAKNLKILCAMSDKFNLLASGPDGSELSTVKDGIFQISSRRRLGLTEFQVVKEFQDGVLEIIKREQTGL